VSSKWTWIQDIVSIFFIFSMKYFFHYKNSTLYPVLQTLIFLVSDWSISKKSSPLKLLSHLNWNLVGSIYMYGRFCIKFPQSRMKGEQHWISSLNLYCSKFHSFLNHLFSVLPCIQFSRHWFYRWTSYTIVFIVLLSSILYFPASIFKHIIKIEFKIRY
jgi:hypothetical protein